jgi:hypothetical protein
MNILQRENSLMGIRVLLPTPLSEKAMDAVKNSAEKFSEIKIL